MQRILLACIVLALLSPIISAMPAHKDTKYGYKITPPKDWLAPTRGSDSKWIVGEFISKKKTFYNSPEGWTWSYKPEMTIIAFVKVKKQGAVTAGEEIEGKKKITSITLHNPYKDYKDYLKRTFHEGGYYFSEEKESKVKDVPVTCLTAKVEKLTRTGPLRIVTWVYHMDEVDIAVQFKVLEKSWSKLKAEILRSLKSFRKIERESEIPDQGLTINLSRADWDKLPPKERVAKYKDLEKKAHEKAVKELPKGWKKYKVGDILVLDNYKAKVAKNVAKHCQAVMKWLDKSFDFVGPDEYVRAPIVKVFKADEPNSILFSFGGGLLDNIIIEYQHTTSFLSELNFEQVSRRTLEHWFTERDRDLYWAMPYWIKNGLSDLVCNSRSKGARLEFPEDLHDRLDLKQAHDKGKLSNPRALILMGREEYYSGRWKTDEASALVRYLTIGPGSKNKKTKDIIFRYLQNLADVTAEIKKEEDAKGSSDKPKTEEEEDAYFKQKQNAWKEKEKRIMEETFNRTFVNWTTRDWKTFTNSYMRMIDS